jgi:hypothetical protein
MGTMLVAMGVAGDAANAQSPMEREARAVERNNLLANIRDLAVRADPTDHMIFFNRFGTAPSWVEDREGGFLAGTQTTDRSSEFRAISYKFFRKEKKIRIKILLNVRLVCISEKDVYESFKDLKEIITPKFPIFPSNTNISEANIDRVLESMTKYPSALGYQTTNLQGRAVAIEFLFGYNPCAQDFEIEVDLSE